MTQEELYAHPGWRWCTSEGSREFDRLVDSRLTFREKLEWLEQAETIVLTLRASRERWKQGSAPPAEL
jgi:hypothetical protein